jgi:hypothetical protein
MFCSDVKAPAALSEVLAAVGTTWGASKLGGPNIKECLQLRKLAPLRSRFSGVLREADPICSWGRPMTQRKKQVYALCGTAVAGGRASKERFAEITSGRSSSQPGLVATGKDSLTRHSRRTGEREGIGA